MVKCQIFAAKKEAFGEKNHNFFVPKPPLELFSYEILAISLIARHSLSLR